MFTAIESDSIEILNYLIEQGVDICNLDILLLDFNQVFIFIFYSGIYNIILQSSNSYSCN